MDRDVIVVSLIVAVRADLAASAVLAKVPAAPANLGVAAGVGPVVLAVYRGLVKSCPSSFRRD